jgi:hypothetical protein
MIKPEVRIIRYWEKWHSGYMHRVEERATFLGIKYWKLYGDRYIESHAINYANRRYDELMTAYNDSLKPTESQERTERVIWQKPAPHRIKGIGKPV